MDGEGVTAPYVAVWDEDGWVVENVGVPPDIEVEQTPAEVILEELEANPPTKLERPPYPVRVWQE